MKYLVKILKNKYFLVKSEQVSVRFLSKAIRNWIFDATFKNSFLLGKRLYKATEYFPQFRKSPSNTLYRCMAVSKSLLIAAQTKGKPLILKHRTYSSWTYDLKAAQTFGQYKYGEAALANLMLVIVKKIFKDQNIVCNIEKAGKYLIKLSEQNVIEKKKVSFSKSLLEKEKEIVIRNPQDNFVFKPQDIHSYSKLEERVDWKSFKVLIS